MKSLTGGTPTLSTDDIHRSCAYLHLEYSGIQAGLEEVWPQGCRSGSVSEKGPDEGGRRDDGRHGIGQTSFGCPFHLQSSCPAICPRCKCCCRHFNRA